MGRNLKSRLQSIRNTNKSIAASDGCSKDSSALPETSKNLGGAGQTWPGWVEAGYMLLKRKIARELPFCLPGSFPAALAIIVPDIARMGRLPLPGELLFFDLETTGLSGGAGTIAFLAAFGRFVCMPAKKARAVIEITQYLLLDYPGESDFVENVLKEFSPSSLLVSYNGKCFDSQILKTRCLMNGIKPPLYFHADLLHPARRLWKRVLPDCSQATIEEAVLGLDRTGDVSGAMAPELWFSFLKSGENSGLLSVCDHNSKDIRGLASLFLALGEIAAKPLESRSRFRFDEEALAFAYRTALKRNPDRDSGNSFVFGDDYLKHAKTGEALLKNAAKNGSARAAVIMAIDAEWRQKSFSLALEYTEAALALTVEQGSLKEKLEKRRDRLLGKVP